MRRFVLPLIAIVALAAIMLPMEFIARLLYSETGVPSCIVFSDPMRGAQAIPNSSCDQKILESKMAKFQFNNCGHRNPVDCGAKRPGVYRIVLVGSSLALGFPVAYEESFQGLLPAILSRQTGRDVEVYSEGMELRTPRYVMRNFDEVKYQHPDMILWPITPWDIAYGGLLVPAQDREALKNESQWQKLKAYLLRERDLGEVLGKHWRACFMMQHLLYKSDTIYLAHSLSASDLYSSSLRDRPDKDWQDKLDEFDRYFAEIAALAKADGIPLVMVAVPRHAQAAILASGKAQPGMNPYAFGAQMKAIAESHGATYVDILPMFRGMPDVNASFFPVDQHLTVKGYRVVAGMMMRALTEGPNPALNRAN